MQVRELIDEARKCRELALDYGGCPEQRLLLSIASAFDQLAREGHRQRSNSRSPNGWEVGSRLPQSIVRRQRQELDQLV